MTVVGKKYRDNTDGRVVEVVAKKDEWNWVFGEESRSGSLRHDNSLEPYVDKFVAGDQWRYKWGEDIYTVVYADDALVFSTYYLRSKDPRGETVGGCWQYQSEMTNASDIIRVTGGSL